MCVRPGPFARSGRPDLVASKPGVDSGLAGLGRAQGDVCSELGALGGWTARGMIAWQSVRRRARRGPPSNETSWREPPGHTGARGRQGGTPDPYPRHGRKAGTKQHFPSRLKQHCCRQVCWRGPSPTLRGTVGPEGAQWPRREDAARGPAWTKDLPPRPLSGRFTPEEACLLRHAPPGRKPALPPPKLLAGHH